MKKQHILSLSLICLFGFGLLLACKKDKNAPDPAPGTGTIIPAPTIVSFSPASGGAGARVVITGTNFSATAASNKVKFGSTEAPVDSASATRLVTRVPKDITTGKITVEVGGKSATSATDFTVQQVPVTIAGTGGASGTANVPSEVTVSAAKVASTIEKEGSRSIIQHGHVWSSTKAEPTVNGRIAATEGKSELGAVPPNATFPYKFQSELKDLDPGTTYNVRSYVTTSEGTTYGSATTVQSKKPCLLTRIGTANFTVFAFSYDAKFNLTQMSRPNSFTSRFTYNADGQLTTFDVTETGGSGVTETYTYTQGRLTKLSRLFKGTSNASTTSYEYDAQGQVTKRTYASGAYFTYVYDKGVLVSQTYTGNDKVVGTYTVANGNLTRYDNGAGTITTYERDALGNVIKSETTKDGKVQSTSTYKYEDKPSVVQRLFTFKGWLPDQLSEGFFSTYPPGGNGKYMRTEQNGTYLDTNGQTIKYTSRDTFSYQGDRPTNYVTVFNDRTPSTYSFTYSGDCD